MHGTPSAETPRAQSHLRWSNRLIYLAIILGLVAYFLFVAGVITAGRGLR